MLKIIKADQRGDSFVKAVIFGPSGSGKTTQARTLPEDETIFMDLEAGTLALGDWGKDSIVSVRDLAKQFKAHPWEIARALAVFIGGHDPSDAAGAYSLGAYQGICEMFGDPAGLAKYKNLFVDSITVASRECFKWCQTQPDAFSEKTGKPDTRGAYGLLKREMMRWITHLQHTPKNIIMVGILNTVMDDLKRVTHTPQIEGAGTAQELPGVFDEVLTLNTFKAEDGSDYRAFCTHQVNPWSYPAKDRSGTLALLEPPNLNALLTKIKTGKRIDTLVTTTQPL